MTQPAAAAVGNADVLPVLARGRCPHPGSLAPQLAAPRQEGWAAGEAPRCPAGRAAVQHLECMGVVPTGPPEGSATNSWHQKPHQAGDLFGLKPGYCKPCLSLGLGSRFFSLGWGDLPGGLGSMTDHAPKTLGACSYRGGRFR